MSIRRIEMMDKRKRGLIHTCT